MTKHEEEEGGMKKYNLNVPYGDKKRTFVLMVADLIHHAYTKGYEMTFTDSRVKHRIGSLHHEGLAIDLNLYKNGVWLKDGTGHDELHEHWDTLGGARRITNDLNHYSVEHEGMR